MLPDARLRTRVPRLRRGGRTPEVVIKVVSPGSNTLKAIRLHFEELQNGKNRALEMDSFGTPVVGRRAARELIEDWDLDLDELHWRQPYLVPARRRSPKVVHKIRFSMPTGTPPDKLLAAVRTFARQQFADRYRYALALHTDEAHPHVHLVLKSMTEDAMHLNIRKPMLPAWRREFVHHLGRRDSRRKQPRGRAAGKGDRASSTAYIER